MVYKLIYQLRNDANLPFLRCIKNVFRPFRASSPSAESLLSNSIFLALSPGVPHTLSYSVFCTTLCLVSLGLHHLHDCFYGCKTAKILQESAPSCFCWQESSYLQKSAHIFKMLLKCESVPRIFKFEG